MDISYQWWGFRLGLTHEQAQSVVKFAASGSAGSAAIAGLLAATGVGAVAAGIVAAAMAVASAWVAACDDGNGATIYCSWWTGWVWVENPA